MSLIIATVNTMWADTLTATESGNVVPTCDKIIDLKWCLLGMAGTVYGSRRAERALALQASSEILTENEVEQTLQNEFRREIDNGDYTHVPSLLVVTGTSLLRVNNGECLVENLSHRGFAAIGCVAPFAEGYLTDREITEETVRKAFIHSCQRNVFVNSIIRTVSI